MSSRVGSGVTPEHARIDVQKEVDRLKDSTPGKSKVYWLARETVEADDPETGSGAVRETVEADDPETGSGAVRETGDSGDFESSKEFDFNYESDPDEHESLPSSRYVVPVESVLRDFGGQVEYVATHPSFFKDATSVPAAAAKARVPEPEKGKPGALRRRKSSVKELNLQPSALAPVRAPPALATTYTSRRQLRMPSPSPAPRESWASWVRNLGNVAKEWVKGAMGRKDSSVYFIF